MNIYVASSWRNERQPAVVEALRAAGHQVYDFRNPTPSDHGFSWRQILPEPPPWSAEMTRAVLSHEVADHGFNLDFSAMKRADACVMVQPCGRSAALELGWSVGAGKRTIALLADGQEPELMLKLADHVCVSLDEVILRLSEQVSPFHRNDVYRQLRDIRALQATAEAERDQARHQRDHHYAVCENAKAAARKLGEELSAVRARLEPPKHVAGCSFDRLARTGCTCGAVPPTDPASTLPRDPDPAWWDVPAELADASTIRVGDRYLGPAIGRWITALGPWRWRRAALGEEGAMKTVAIDVEDLDVMLAFIDRWNGETMFDPESGNPFTIVPLARERAAIDRVKHAIIRAEVGS